VANLKPELWVCLYDIHYPQFDQKTFRTILSFIKKKHAHGLLLGGDALDLSCVSHWNKNFTARLLDLVAAILRATELALMLTATKTIFRELHEPAPARPAPKADPKPEPPPINLDWHDVQAINKKKRAATSEELEHIIKHHKQFSLTNWQVNEIRLRVILAVVNRARPQVCDPNTEFIYNTLPESCVNPTDIPLAANLASVLFFAKARYASGVREFRRRRNQHLAQDPQGLSTSAPIPSKSATFLVATVRPCTRAVAAIRVSRSERGLGM